MKHLIPSTNSQTKLKLYQEYIQQAVTIKLRDDSTNSEVENTPTATVNKNYLRAFFSVFTLIRG